MLYIVGRSDGRPFDVTTKRGSNNKDIIAFSKSYTEMQFKTTKKPSHNQILKTFADKGFFAYVFMRFRNKRRSSEKQAPLDFEAEPA